MTDERPLTKLKICYATEWDGSANTDEFDSPDVAYAKGFNDCLDRLIRRGCLIEIVPAPFSPAPASIESEK